MANNPSPFNFGSGSSNIFGQTPSSASKPLFGQATTTSASNAASPSTAAPSGASQTSNLFGNLGSTTSQPSQSGGLFAGLNSTSNTPKPSLFGSNPPSMTAGSSAPLFGGATANGSAGSNIFGSTPAAKPTTSSTSLFGGGSGAPTFSFGQNKDSNAGGSQAASTVNKPEASQQSSGGGTASGTSLFANISTPTASTTPGSTTPATTKTTNPLSFANSTTPAGPPPTTSATNTAPTNNIFGSATQPLAGGLFGGQKPTDISTSKPQGGGLFGGAGSSGTTSNLFNAADAPSLSTTPAASNSTTPASKPAFSFPSLTSATSQAPTMTTSTSAATPSLFGTATSQPAQSTPSTATGLGTVGTSGATSTSTAAPSLFAGLNKSSSTAAPAATTTTATSGASTTSAAAPSPFQPAASQSTSNAATATSAPTAQGSTATAGGAASGASASTAAPFGASTAGPAPQLSRLKNKTIDEIITRWASDLSKYQKEFQDQAAKVAQWDRLLVENGDKIQKLYTSTYEAERATAEVERQLTAVEGHQDELAAWLDRYEAEVDDMFARQVGPGEALQGPDQERERTYKLAEKLTDRLDEMGKDLTNMIQEINTASAALSRTSKPDDPLSQIVRVLNGHLAQLQWIDQNTAALQAKVSVAQKETQGLIANGKADKDPAEEIFRSYLGRK